MSHEHHVCVASDAAFVLPAYTVTSRRTQCETDQGRRECVPLVQKSPPSLFFSRASRHAKEKRCLATKTFGALNWTRVTRKGQGDTKGFRLCPARPQGHTDVNKTFIERIRMGKHHARFQVQLQRKQREDLGEQGSVNAFQSKIHPRKYLHDPQKTGHCSFFSAICTTDAMFQTFLVGSLQVALRSPAPIGGDVNLN